MVTCGSDGPNPADLVLQSQARENLVNSIVSSIFWFVANTSLWASNFYKMKNKTTSDVLNDVSKKEIDIVCQW